MTRPTSGMAFPRTEIPVPIAVQENGTPVVADLRIVNFVVGANVTDGGSGEAEVGLTIPNITVSDTEPVGPALNDLWVDTTP